MLLDCFIKKLYAVSTLNRDFYAEDLIEKKKKRLNPIKIILKPIEYTGKRIDES